MKTIFTEFNAGMENLYNSFFISFLALKPLIERPLSQDFRIPIADFSYSLLEASQLNKLGDDSVNEYVNGIRRHMLNDIVICYERYATLMLAAHLASNKRVEVDDRTINAATFEKLPGLYEEAEKTFFKQLRHLRNSIVHYNGVYNKANPLNYIFHNNTYNSVGHEGDNIQIELDSIMFIYNEVLKKVTEINQRYFSKFIVLP